MKRLTRTPDDKWIGGVCGGIGVYSGLDPNLVRLITGVLLVVTGLFPVAVLYVLAWAIMPRA